MTKKPSESEEEYFARQDAEARERAAKQEPAAGSGAPVREADAGASASAPSAPMAAAGLMGALGRVGEPGYYDEPKQSPGARSDAPHHVIVEIAGGVAELES